jgi:DNA primase
VTSAPSRTVHLTHPEKQLFESGFTKRDLADYYRVSGLEWLSNQSAIEFHTPQWRVGPRGGIRNPGPLCRMNGDGVA